ncbi:MAG: phosphate signaling complex protein PhoU [Gammaproteobacteria bacterium]|nr:phosphate signaling complex protein PhoU [Gammaproteobacteria bacterium]
MDARQLGQHTYQKFDDELESIRQKLLKAGGLVESQLKGALEALAEFDEKRAQAIIDDDEKVNDLEVEIDQLCTEVIARRQPMASDLRMLIASFKIINDLERMGDESVRIARMALRLVEGSNRDSRYFEIRNLGEHVRRMLRDALDAFARTDMKLAMTVLEEDRIVDREYASLTRALITFMMEDPREIPRMLEVQWSARALERIGDRACNIAEYVIYFASGKDVRHQSVEEMRSDVRGFE